MKEEDGRKYSPGQRRSDEDEGKSGILSSKFYEHL